MTAPTRPRLWTHSVSTDGWVGDTSRNIVLGWDVAHADRIALCLPGDVEPLWLGRDDAAQGVDRPVGDWMWPCSFHGAPHVAIRPLVGAEVVRVREDVLGRFLARTEWFVSHGREDFAAEAAALLGGAR